MIYSDTDSLVYDIFTPDIYEWIKNNKHYFDLSDSMRPDLKDDANKKTLGKFKDEMQSLIISKFVALNPKVYSIMHQHFDKSLNKVVETNTEKCKGISKVVVKQDLTHNDYVSVLKPTNQLAVDCINTLFQPTIVYL